MEKNLTIKEIIFNQKKIIIMGNMILYIQYET